MEKNKFENIEGIEHLKKRRKTEKRAIRFTIEEEKKENRKIIIAPLDSPYDLKSLGNDPEDVRFIEVKGHLAPFPNTLPYCSACLTIQEFNFAKEMKDKFWLYIIYGVRKNEKIRRIFKIQNPIENMKWVFMHFNKNKPFYFFFKEVSDMNDSFKMKNQ